MLLNQIISNQHALYAEIQSQIEALQEQQRQIQAYLQRLGSVESKMESAAQLVAEAIAEIKSVCPDEITSYQETITSLFGSSPIAQLSAAPNDDEPPAPPAPPAPPENPSNSSSSNDAIDTSVIQSEIVSSEPKEVGESHSEPDFSRISWQKLQKLAAKFNIGTRGLKRPQVESLLQEQGISQPDIDSAA